MEITEDFRSNVSPPTDQKFEIGPELKGQVTGENATGVNVGIFVNGPLVESWFTTLVSQWATSLALFTLVESKSAVPEKPIWPTMGAASWSD